ncbi:MAG: TRAM domain-containing protein [Armatimonadota bacterium]|nr:TRAM domain-containing protein [Armatimonadota bacterium]MDR7421146.1 TRAM domain-containing protein [Armatimonadota bacterium]MDR7453461.1 TRAM domain-containing protein [Armatimonadota bacterium]MDR7457243.1 TRAM domain-containing protein [Armatimonadota bacterium]MDR7496108.1 TRAM domain-containing protein [Armatimonadota bacterium]
MRERVIRGAGVLLGGIAGHEIVRLARLWVPFVVTDDFVVTAAGVVVGGLGGWLLMPIVSRAFVTAMAWALHGLSALSLHELLLAAFGLTSGLLIAYIVGGLLEGLPLVGPYVRLVAAVVLGYLGLHLARQRRDEVTHALSRVAARREPDRPAGDAGGPRASAKLLDTSVIIDGRITDVAMAGFLEGPLLVPRSVLLELQRIADSPDAVKRNRGRRGLDILNRLQKEFATVQILEDAAGGRDVDNQLVALARDRGAAIVTTDFNLSKIAELQGVRVLNVNQLAQALRPTVLPGEELSVHIIRDGKEAGQGVAYLEDGTMIVVEGGKRYMGETFDVVVTSVLQTSAGRMVFARPKSSEPAGPTVERR